jgi:hypothetical protein
MILTVIMKKLDMRKKREYRGCEWESPIFREIMREKWAKEGKTKINEYRTKRGKRSSL